MPSATVIYWLLTCLREPLEVGETSLRATLLANRSETEWSLLTQLAERHGLMPLLYDHLHGSVELWSAIPAQVQERLQESYFQNALRNLLIIDQFIEVTKALQQINVPVIGLKGVYLAQSVYPHCALREIGDIDLLVRRHEVAHAEKVLQAMGYRLNDWRTREWSLSNHYHLTYTHPDHLVTIELHWHIQRPQTPYPVEIEDLWRCAKPISIGGIETLGLAAEHLLLYHCLHIARHGFKVGLRYFYDLAAILRHHQDQISWDALAEQANRWQITKVLSLSLYLTHEFFGGLAASVSKEIGAAGICMDVVESARDQVFTYGDKSLQLSAEYMQQLERDHYQKRRIHLLRRVFLSPALMARIYSLPCHSWRIYFYYLVRLCELVIWYPNSLRHLIRQDEALLAWAAQKNKVAELRAWLEP